MTPGQTPDHGEPEPVVRPPPGGEEWLDGAGPMLLVDSGTFVRHRDDHVAVVPIRADSDPPPIGHRLDRALDGVGEGRDEDGRGLDEKGLR